MSEEVNSRKPAEEISNDEILDLVNETGRVIGQARRSEVHGNPALLHRVIHVLVFGSDGRLFLQKRADHKEGWPGLWDSSVGGHVDAGESVSDAVVRELAEELGIPGPGNEAPELKALYSYIHRNNHESELVNTFMCRWDGPFELQESELSDGRYWELSEIDSCAEANPEAHPFTPNFLDEVRRWREAGSPLP